MVYLADRAEGHLRNAEPAAAIRDAQLAQDLADANPDGAEAQISVRAMLAGIDGLALADRLDEAESLAVEAVTEATLFCDRGRWHALAELRLSETLELQGRYRAAGEGFVKLEEGLPNSWGADIKMWCANHMISTGLHSTDRALQDIGIQRGSEMRPLVDDADQVASFLQWRGIAESRRFEPEKAERTFAESFPLRDRTVRREVTKGFLLADIAYAYGEQEKGDRLLQEALDRARKAGLWGIHLTGLPRVPRLVNDGAQRRDVSVA